jgi:hypothetical protein
MRYGNYDYRIATLYSFHYRSTLQLVPPAAGKYASVV